MQTQFNELKLGSRLKQTHVQLHACCGQDKKICLEKTKWADDLGALQVQLHDQSMQLGRSQHVYIIAIHSMG